MPRAELRIRRLGIRVPPSALKKLCCREAGAQAATVTVIS